MKSNTKGILKECINCLKQNSSGLFWIEILKKVSDKAYGLSINNITKTIFWDLIKVDSVDYSVNGYFQFNNKKQCSLKWIISINPKINLVHYFLSANAILSTTNVKRELENVTIEDLHNYNIINEKIYSVLNECKITTLIELHNHIFRNNHFLKARGCSIKCNYDILQLYEDYYVRLIGGQEETEQKLSVDKKRRNKKPNNINEFIAPRKNAVKKNVVATIRETFNAKLITTNAYNICKVLNIKDTYELKSFIESHRNFLMIKKCTKKENEQLLKLNDLYNK